MVDPISNHPQPQGHHPMAAFLVKEFGKEYKSDIANVVKTKNDPEAHQAACKQLMKDAAQYVGQLLMHAPAQLPPSSNPSQPGGKILAESHQMLSNANAPEAEHVSAASLASGWAQHIAGKSTAEGNEAAEQVTNVANNFLAGNASAADVAEAVNSLQVTLK